MCRGFIVLLGNVFLIRKRMRQETWFVSFNHSWINNVELAVLESRFYVIWVFLDTMPWACGELDALNPLSFEMTLIRVILTQDTNSDAPLAFCDFSQCCLLHPQRMSYKHPARRNRFQARNHTYSHTNKKVESLNIMANDFKIISANKRNRI